MVPMSLVVDIELAEGVLAVIDALKGWTVTTRKETELHRAVDTMLRPTKLAFKAEVEILAGSRVDFAIELPETKRTLALECKVQGSTGTLTRQLVRYAGVDTVAGVMLITTRRRHLSIMPAWVCSKPFRSIYVGP